MLRGGISSPFFCGLGVALLLALTCAGVCAEAPTKMIHVIIRMSGTGIPEDSFPSKPKTFWRAGTQYCRVDEEPDPEKGIHGRLVINEPDAWLINLEDKTAKYMLDKGPSFNCRLPIFAMDKEMATSKIGELEVGRELDFFQANGARVVEGPKLSFEAKYYEVDIGDSVIRMVERVDIHSPIMIVLTAGDKTYGARYDLWEEVPFKGDLFAKPDGVKIEQSK